MEELKKKRKYWIQGILAVLTLITTTIAGSEWMFGKSLFYGETLLTSGELWAGLYFSIPFLGILTVHEFGHYLTAKHYKIPVTLPYYIPFWLGPFLMPSIGTMGAFIRITGKIRSRMEFFDVGIAGPLAGFVVAMGILFYGFTNLPPAEYIFEIHPEYEEYGLNYEEHVYEDHPMIFAVGNNMIFWFFENYVADPTLVPNQYEMYHYPLLFAGYLALFFTALNLIPIGQLDGGHVLYGLLGLKWSKLVSRFLFVTMVTISGIGLIPFGELDFSFFLSLFLYFWFLILTFYHFARDLKIRALIVIWVIIVQLFATEYIPLNGDYSFYLFFAFLIGRFLGVDHPAALTDKPLSLGRRILGWISLGIFIISFTPSPLYFKENKNARDHQPGHEEQYTQSNAVARRVIEVDKI